MNDTITNKLYCVTARLQTTTMGDTQFDAVEAALFNARDNYTPNIDLVSLHINDAFNNSPVTVYMEAVFYVTATQDTSVSEITRDTIKTLSFPENGTFNIISQSFRHVKNINDVNPHWLNAQPFSIDASSELTCKQILTQ